jgi:plasmid maintenance system killer protein
LTSSLPMVILFKNNKLEKILCDHKALIRHFGLDQAKKIEQRLLELKASENLHILESLPQVRAHELTGNRAGQISLDLKHPYRLLIVPAYDDPPLKDDGGLDWEKVTKIKIMEVEDTHG